MESADDEDAVEREVMRDRNAPSFGEQALQPLKVRLRACELVTKDLRVRGVQKRLAVIRASVR